MPLRCKKILQFFWITRISRSIINNKIIWITRISRSIINNNLIWITRISRSIINNNLIWKTRISRSIINNNLIRITRISRSIINNKLNRITGISRSIINNNLKLVHHMFNRPTIIFKFRTRLVILANLITCMIIINSLLWNKCPPIKKIRVKDFHKKCPINLMMP